MSANANIRAGRAYFEVTAETSKLKQNLSAAQSQLRDFAKACQGLGKDMMALSGALSLPFVLAEKSFAGFDDKMRLVQAVTSSTGDQFTELTKTAQRLGRETSFTAQQVADAMIGLGRMGFNPSEIVSAIDNVLNLSRATGTDLSAAADIAANSLRVFGLEAGKGLLREDERQRECAAQGHHVAPQPLTRLAEVSELGLRGVEVGAEL